MSVEIESRVRKLETDMTVLNKDVEAVRVSVGDVKTDTTDIKADIKWVVRLIIGALLMAVVAFAMKGGFTLAS